MAADPATVLDCRSPAGQTEDVAMLHDMAKKFLEAEIAPRIRANYEKNEIVDRASLGKGRRGRAAVRVHAGRIWRRRRHLRP